MIRIDIHYITRCLSVHACMPVRPTDCLSNFNFVCFIFKLFLYRDINLIYHLNTNPFALIFTAQQLTKERKNKKEEKMIRLEPRLDESLQVTISKLP